MLGALKKKPVGTWLAHGKHPAARDFFTVGENHALGEAFIDWIDRGVKSLPEQKKALSVPISWRFWSRSPQQDYLTCGVVKNSFDGLRRLFPLLVLGAGRVTGWEEHWDLLPLLYEETWERIEGLTAQNYQGVPQFKRGLAQLRYPVLGWAELATASGGLIASSSCNDPLHLCGSGALAPELIETLRQTGRAMVAIEAASEKDLTLVALQLHQRFQREMHAPPSSVFLGGGVDRSFLALFNGPLRNEDFSRLWNPFSD